MDEKALIPKFITLSFFTLLKRFEKTKKKFIFITVFASLNVVTFFALIIVLIGVGATFVSAWSYLANVRLVTRLIKSSFSKISL